MQVTFFLTSAYPLPATRSAAAAEPVKGVPSKTTAYCIRMIQASLLVCAFSGYVENSIQKLNFKVCCACIWFALAATTS